MFSYKIHSAYKYCFINNLGIIYKGFYKWSRKLVSCLHADMMFYIGYKGNKKNNETKLFIKYFAIFVQ